MFFFLSKLLSIEIFSELQKHFLCVQQYTYWSLTEQFRIQFCTRMSWYRLSNATGSRIIIFGKDKNSFRWKIILEWRNEFEITLSFIAAFLWTNLIYLTLIREGCKKNLLMDRGSMRALATPPPLVLRWIPYVLLKFCNWKRLKKWSLSSHQVVTKY